MYTNYPSGSKRLKLTLTNLHLYHPCWYVKSAVSIFVLQISTFPEVCYFSKQVLLWKNQKSLCNAHKGYPPHINTFVRFFSLSHLNGTLLYYSRNLCIIQKFIKWNDVIFSVKLLHLYPLSYYNYIGNVHKWRPILG